MSRIGHLIFIAIYKKAVVVFNQWGAVKLIYVKSKFYESFRRRQLSG